MKFSAVLKYLKRICKKESCRSIAAGLLLVNCVFLL